MAETIAGIAPLLSVPFLVFIGFVVSVIWVRQERLLNTRIGVLQQQLEAARDEARALQAKLDRPSDLRVELDLLRDNATREREAWDERVRHLTREIEEQRLELEALKRAPTSPDKRSGFTTEEMGSQLRDDLTSTTARLDELFVRILSHASDQAATTANESFDDVDSQLHQSARRMAEKHAESMGLGEEYRTWMRERVLQRSN